MWIDDFRLTIDDSGQTLSYHLLPETGPFIAGPSSMAWLNFRKIFQGLTVDCFRMNKNIAHSINLSDWHKGLFKVF